MVIHPQQFIKQILPQPLKKGIKHLIWAIEGNKHSLPHFIVIGAAKAGTTFLYTYLTQHPQILEAKVKEVQFFSTRYHNGIMWYRSQFPNRSKIKRGFITGEASPYYLFHPHAPKRIFQLLPNAKLIVLLRDPVDRAISHYFHEVNENNEFLPIEEAFRNEEERLEPELIRMQRDESYNSKVYRCYSYKKRGIYVDQLVEYFNYFNRNQLLILKSEDLFFDPKNILKEIFIFLDVDVDSDRLPVDISPKNMGNYTTKVSPQVYKELVNYYTPHNARLYQLLGRDFEWKTP